ncbi:MAG: 50S ribosomal protein L32 [Candidatus Omnitrophica bacterium]|nr:50S ribosomal protein L32 [Candidatus Omnitrophota bacterium]MBU4303689.1 50S ribosomal protein L32 [Candidatus Omnitrophota bacterium]MBU4418792.1 50S ribosomal protein L32 [Candidatus Omnitrophota bacterium]MBU4468447.1 50S ribosomal protein L32 [Candidatus Omnitrophota bacterium]MCG2708439.1 50S ribosomal protein L32 [Candidatus Omnitrophota bacterium]
MPLPKRKHSTARGRKRRTHWKIKVATLTPCPQCKQLKLPHRVCLACGFYAGRQVVEIKVKEKKKKSR